MADSLYYYHAESIHRTYPDVTVVEKPSAELIRGYIGKLPNEILRLWEQRGWGIYMTGFLRLLNPADVSEFIDEYVEISTPSVPFAVTAFGDLLMWLEDGYVEVISFRKGDREIVESGMDLFLNDTLVDFAYAIKEFRAAQFNEAISKLGVPAFDQCFGYVPLLALGGSESIGNLQLADLQSHIAIMAQVVGPL